MATFQIPFNRARRNYSAQVNLDGVNYTFQIRYNRRLDSWVMDVKNVVNGIRIVGGVELLEQHKHRAVPQGTMRILDLEGLNRTPTLETFGDSIIVTYEPV